MKSAYPDKKNSSGKKVNEDEEKFYEQNSDEKKYPDDYLRTDEPESEPDSNEEYLRIELPEDNDDDKPRDDSNAD